MVKHCNALIRLALVGVGLLAVVSPAAAIRLRLWPAGVPPFSRPRENTDLWRGYRSIIVLPTKNEAQGGASLATVADEEFRKHLRSSRKFSLEDIHPRSPVFIRARNENLMQEADVLRWQQQHLIDDAFNLGGTMGVQSVGELKIAGYQIQDVGKQDKALTISVVGVMYNMKSRQKEREVAATAMAQLPRRNPNAATLERSVLREATEKVVNGFLGIKEVEKPVKPKVEKPKPQPKPAPAKAAPAKPKEPRGPVSGGFPPDPDR